MKLCRRNAIGLLAGLTGMVMVSGAVARDYYPERALAAEVSGEAIIECVLQADDSVRDCIVVRETPAGYGFGKATVQLFEDQYNINQQPQAKEKKVAGDRATFTYRWTLN